MRYPWSLLAILPVALSSALACESERPIADDLLRIDAGQVPSGGGTGGQPNEDASVAATEEDASVPPAGMTDAGADGGGLSACERADRAFRDFVADNGSCERSSDCTIIGDCGPNADFTAINVAAAAEGYALMEARCDGTFDGPTFAARCEGGVCALGPENGCCGCPSDAGP